MQSDLLFITSGEKDVLSLVAHGFSAICFNSETAHIPKEKIAMLKPRFQHIVLLFDTDETSKKAALKVAEQLCELGVLMLVLPLAGTKKEKDISDYFQIGHTPQQLRCLVSETLKSQYSERLSLLKSCEIHWDIPPEKQQTLIAIERIPIGVQSNLLGITGGEGTEKSHFVAALLAGCLTQTKQVHIDTLRTQVTPCPKGKTVCFSIRNNPKTSSIRTSNGYSNVLNSQQC